MAQWERWIQMASDSFDAAESLLEGDSFARSSVSRFYYCAYQAATALLLYCEQTPPIVDGVQRESWSHEVTPDMLVDNLRRVLAKDNSRYGFRTLLQDLYKARVYADYVGNPEVSKQRLQDVRRKARFMLKVGKEILIE